MADKSFGVRELNLTNTSGTPTVSSPNQLNLSAHTVAISTSVTVGQNLTVSANAGISSLNVTGIGTVLNLNVLGVGTITSPSDANAHSRWKVTNQSASAYRFTGPGQDGSENNPNVYLVRGQRYIFDVNASGHPFQLRVANGGAAYSDGVTNNGAQSGQVIFNVQHDAPAQLYYQCTNHGGMVGNIYVIGGPQVISGVVTATTFVGNLTGNPTGTLQTAAQPNITSVGTLSALTVSGNINVTSSDPTIVFVDSDNNPDFDIKAGGGRFVVRDSTNNAERLRITSAGTAVFGGDTSTPIVDNGELFYRGNSTSTFGFPQNFYLYSDDIAYNGTNPGAGMLFGGAYDSSGNYTTYAGIHGIKENSTSANANGALVFGTRQNGSGSWERLRIESGGDVSIGGMDANTFSNYRTLTIGGAGASDGAGIDLEKSDGNIYGRFFADANGVQLQTAQSGDYFRFETHNGSGVGERLRITSAGYVGINETNPSYQLDVKGDTGATFSAGSNSTAGMITISGRNSGGSGSALSRLKSYPDGSSTQSHFAIETRNSSASMIERFRITSSGEINFANVTVAQKNTSGDIVIDISNLTNNGSNYWRKVGVWIMYNGIKPDATNNYSVVYYAGVGSVSTWNWLGDQDTLTSDSFSSVSLQNAAATSFRLYCDINNQNVGNVFVMVHAWNTKPTVTIN